MIHFIGTLALAPTFECQCSGILIAKDSARRTLVPETATTTIGPSRSAFLDDLASRVVSLARCGGNRQPETVVSWHRAGIRLYWRWKSRPWGGRPRIAPELRALIRRMAKENTGWGAPKIHGELQNAAYQARWVSPDPIRGRKRY